MIKRTECLLNCWCVLIICTECTNSKRVVSLNFYRVGSTLCFRDVFVIELVFIIARLYSLQQCLVDNLVMMGVAMSVTVGMVFFGVDFPVEHFDADPSGNWDSKYDAD